MTGYFMTKEQAVALAKEDRAYFAQPRPDRHGDHPNGFTLRPDTVGRLGQPFVPLGFCRQGVNPSTENINVYNVYAKIKVLVHNLNR
jgi:hypothetical protein